MDPLVTWVRTYLTLVRKIFLLQYIPLYIAAVGFTYVLVMLGVDWAYFLFIMKRVPRPFLFISDLLGFLIPIFLPLVLYMFSKIRKSAYLRILAEATMYATFLGLSVSTCIKSFTGRVSPPDDGNMLVDTSHAFQFGFMREQIIGGWPSSHTTIAFALATTLVLLCPQSWRVKVLALSTAVCIGIGVTFGWHWLSEFVAGALIGTALGHVVGRYYYLKLDYI